jgi:hypothetical protein
LDLIKTASRKFRTFGKFFFNSPLRYYFYGL